MGWELALPFSECPFLLGVAVDPSFSWSGLALFSWSTGGRHLLFFLRSCSEPFLLNVGPSWGRCWPFLLGVGLTLLPCGWRLAFSPWSRCWPFLLPSQGWVGSSFSGLGWFFLLGVSLSFRVGGWPSLLGLEKALLWLALSGLGWPFLLVVGVRPSYPS